MQSFFVLVVGALVGAAATFFLAGGFLIGTGAGAGIVTGVKAGACLTALAANEKGFVTPAPDMNCGRAALCVAERSPERPLLQERGVRDVFELRQPERIAQRVGNLDHF